MYVIKTNDAARMVAEEIRNFVLTDEDLKLRCKGECSVFVDHSRKAFSGLYACVVNSHTRAVKSSYVPGNNTSSKRGCLGFDVMKMRRFFKKEKSWARYYVAVQIGGVSDIENESFARLGTELLYNTVEEMKPIPMNRLVGIKGMYGRIDKLRDQRANAMAEIVVVAE